ncbi:MAG: GLUG motif-containing protein [Planctomycetota bacterium]
MNRKAIILILVGVVTLAGTASAGTYSGGTGEPNNPYRIGTAEDLNDIGNHPEDWGSHFVMVNNVNLADYTGTQFNIIGKSITKFTGVFDGNNHKIVNFTYSGTNLGPVGLFSYVDGVGGVEAEIKDLSLIDPNIDVPTGYAVGALVGQLTDSKIYGCCVEGGKVLGGDKAGGLVGDSGKSTIWDCYSSTNVRSDDGEAGGLVCESARGYIFNCYTTGIVDGSGAGGLVATNDRGTISNCYSTSNVSASYRVGGGLVGYNNDSMISNSYSTGNVSRNGEVGGLVGGNYGTVVNCYAVGNISGTSNVGGLVGYIINGTVSRCYSAGRVEADGDAGGLVGCNEGTITDCYWDTETSEQQYGVGAGDANGVSGKTTAQMKQQATFVNWDFVDFWTIEEGVSYPYFRDYGSGTAEDPYLIRGPKRMQSIGANPYLWDKHFKLIADINLSEYTGTEFNMIGSWSHPFSGVFDGNDHSISKFTYVLMGGFKIGLFSHVDGQNALIKNVTLIEPYIDANYPGFFNGTLVGYIVNGTVLNCTVEGGVIYAGEAATGGLIGRVESGNISNCHTSIRVDRGYSWSWMMGGLIGENENGTIANCSAAGPIHGEEIVGGLVGRNYSGSISDCYATGPVSGWSVLGGLIGESYYHGSVTGCFTSGEVTGTDDYEYAEHIGGLIGANASAVSDCYTICDVNGFEQIGGLVGTNSSVGSITNCFAAGKVQGSNYLGGLIGTNAGAVYSACFWDADVNPDVNGIGNGTDPNVIGKSTAEMMQEATFDNWDFVEIWNIGENQTYPFLRVYPAGDLNHDGRVDLFDFGILAGHWLEGVE